jgi:hypothetical protein
MQIRDLLGSLLASLLLQSEEGQGALYVCSPFLSDFYLLDNAFGQFASLFRHHQETGTKPEILFSEVLVELSRQRPIRIITVKSEHSFAFLRRLIQPQNAAVAARLATGLYHEKGLLCDAFYIEGSMNFTYNGVYRRDEKVAVHIGDTPDGRRKTDAAILEFDRLWTNRAANVFRGEDA